MMPSGAAGGNGGQQCGDGERSCLELARDDQPCRERCAARNETCGERKGEETVGDDAGHEGGSHEKERMHAPLVIVVLPRGKSIARVGRGRLCGRDRPCRGKGRAALVNRMSVAVG
jgi:hypothetical protein